jgi:asparagine synthase (glutamine-hydrolysing)
LVEWLATVPSSLKINDGEGKFLLKKAMEPLVPAEVMYRRKQGFAVPLTRWFRGPLRERLCDALLGPRLAETGYFNPVSVRRMVESHLSGARDHSAPLWALLMFDAFLRNVDREGGVRNVPEEAAA